MKNQYTNIISLEEGCKVNENFIIDNICPGVTKAGKSFFRATMKDAFHSIAAVCWEPQKNIAPVLGGEVVHVIGTVGRYKDAPQISIDSLAIVPKDALDENTLHSLIPTAPISVPEYYD